MDTIDSIQELTNPLSNGIIADPPRTPVLPKFLLQVCGGVRSLRFIATACTQRPAFTSAGLWVQAATVGSP